MKNEQINNEIQKMNISDEAKVVLERIEQAASSNISSFKQSIPGIFLVGDKGTGSTAFARTYDRILTANHVYTVRGTKTFLDLVFPKGGSEKDYQRFFESPRLMASIQNRFFGVFAISFEDWEGRDLIDSEPFSTLLTFIDNNRDNIYFVFKVTGAFKAKDDLKKILNNHVNLLEADIGNPDFDMAFDYIVNCLEVDGVGFSIEGKTELKSILGKKLNMDDSDFAGYRSLQQIAKSILFELLTTGVYEDKSMQVSDSMIREIEAGIITPGAVRSKNRMMGFIN